MTAPAPHCQPDNADGYRAAWLEMLEHCNKLKEENFSLRKALEFFAEAHNWRQNGPLDPNSGMFRGDQVAREALAARLQDHANYLDAEGSQGTFSKDLSDASRLLQSSSCFSADVCKSLPCACASSIAATLQTRVQELTKALREIERIVHVPTKETGHRTAERHFMADFDAIRGTCSVSLKQSGSGK